VYSSTEQNQNKKYCHKNIFANNISGKKIPKIFSNLQNISEKNVFAKIFSNKLF